MIPGTGPTITFDASAAVCLLAFSVCWILWPSRDFPTSVKPQRKDALSSKGVIALWRPLVHVFSMFSDAFTLGLFGWHIYTIV